MRAISFIDKGVRFREPEKLAPGFAASKSYSQWWGTRLLESKNPCFVCETVSQGSFSDS